MHSNSELNAIIYRPSRDINIAQICCGMKFIKFISKSNFFIIQLGYVPMHFFSLEFKQSFNFGFANLSPVFDLIIKS